MVSIIIPTYNEAEVIAGSLQYLTQVRGCFEVLVADGASADATRAIVESLIPGYPHPMRLLRCPRDRAQQLNCAAKAARGQVLLFLHADTRLALDALEAVQRALCQPRILGGNFNLVFDGDDVWSRSFTWVNRVRRRFGIYYGDSGVFVRRHVFDGLGGFKDIPIMDDYEFVRRLERLGPTVLLPQVIRVSDRRWRTQGVLRTVLSWFCIQGLYSLGVPAEHLARWYKPVRRPIDRQLPLRTIKIATPVTAKRT